MSGRGTPDRGDRGQQGSIDGATLERMARIARGFPGRTIAAEADEGGAEEARISVDGIDAGELIDRIS